MPNPSNKTTRSRRRPDATGRARALRKGDNLAEGRLWVELQDRRLGGFKFVRQFPIGPYFADFACREHRLVVELDGSQHADSEHDLRRDDFMTDAGYSLLEPRGAMADGVCLRDHSGRADRSTGGKNGCSRPAVFSGEAAALSSFQMIPLTASLRSAPLPHFRGGEEHRP
jgi:very-short-patch-repair endonuclease